MAFWQWLGDKTTGAGYTTRVVANRLTVYSGTNTFTSGTTATSGQTLSVGILTATITTPAHEIVITNDGPYDLTASIYKVVSAGVSANADISVSFVVPATAVSAGVTIGAKTAQVQGLFNYNLGLVVRLTSTAAFTATVTNYVAMKELDL